MNVRSRMLACCALSLTAGACDALDTRGCPLVAKNGSDSYLLEYELLIPSDCPVPLGGVGEVKSAGARVLDYGNRDFRYAEVHVESSDRRRLNSRITPFSNAGSYSYAEPSTSYVAGTGGAIGTGLDRRYDYGLFFATNNAGGGTTFDPYGEIKITYAASAMANVIDGTTIPPRNSTATWRASAGGGTPPYNYYWYRNGALVGTSEFYTGNTGTENFGLRAVVVDQTMTERAAVMPVDVGGALVRIDGPAEAYVYTDGLAVGGSGTWTAAVQGGTAPFTYQWYRDGYPTGGSTASHTESFHERGGFTLRVEVRDATGKSAVNERFISVAESCSGCQPF